jgi:hypothetical protein
LRGRAAPGPAAKPATGAAPAGDGAPTPAGNGWADTLKDSLGGLMHSSGRKDSVIEAMAKSAARSMGSTAGREIIRGVLGTLLGGSKRR